MVMDVDFVMNENNANDAQKKPDVQPENNTTQSAAAGEVFIKEGIELKEPSIHPGSNASEICVGDEVITNTGDTRKEPELLGVGDKVMTNAGNAPKEPDLLVEHNATEPFVAGEAITNESNALREPDIHQEENVSIICATQDDSNHVGDNGVVETSARKLPAVPDYGDVDPYVGMEFESEFAAQKFYLNYATNMGFKVRISSRRRSPNNYKTIGIEFVCSKEGFRQTSSSRKKLNPRTGCPAMIRIRRKEYKRLSRRAKKKKVVEYVRWAVVKFIKEHNHDLGFLNDNLSQGYLIDESNGSSIFPLKGCRTFIQGLRKGILIRKADYCAADLVKMVDNSGGESVNDSNEPANLEPYVGMQFESEEAATVFYFEYATRVGFDIRINCRRRSARDGASSGVQFVCSREGFRREHCSTTRQPKREGCMARIIVRRGDCGKWTVTKYVKEHCHELFPAEVPSLRPYKLVCQKEDGGSDTVFTLQGRSKKVAQARANYVQSLREKIFGNDSQNLLEYFKHMQVKNAAFFYAIHVDKEYRMTNFFWADARSRMAYNHFGDVITLDVTYNEHGIAFVLFLGTNHHKQPILFGSALLIDDSETSFVWLFNTWAEAISGRHPTVIIFNQDPVVEASILKVLPNTRCHYCKRDILKKVPEKLGDVESKHEDFMRDFSKCICSNELNDEFESCWKSFIDKYELGENEWLRSLYNNREKWVLVYLQDLSSALLFTRNDSAHIFSILPHCADASLQAFVGHIEKAMEKQYEVEFEENCKTSYMKPIMKTGLPMEAQAAEIYTRTLFSDFQDQLFQSLHHTAEITNEEGSIFTAKVAEFGVGKSGYTVNFDSSEVKATCSCQMFEYSGILCRHALRVLSMKNITMLPSHGILKRWTRNSMGADFDHQNPENIDNCPDSWTLRYNSFYFHAAKYALEASSTLNVYYVAIRALREALQEVDAAKGNVAVQQPSAMVNGRRPEGNSYVRTTLDNVSSNVPPSDSQLEQIEVQPTTSNRPLSVEQQKKKRKCQVCKQDDHDKRKCPVLRSAGNNMNATSGTVVSQNLHGGAVPEQFTISHAVSGVPSSDYHFLRYV